MAMRKYGRAGKIWTDDDLLEVASRSVLPKIGFLSNAAPGDVFQFIVPTDCKVVGAYFYQAGDEGGTNGVIEIEAFASVGGAQRTLTGAYTIDGGAEASEEVALSATTANLYLLEGEPVNLKVTTASTNSVQCYITLLVETLELVKY